MLMKNLTVSVHLSTKESLIKIDFVENTYWTKLFESSHHCVA